MHSTNMICDKDVYLGISLLKWNPYSVYSLKVLREALKEDEALEFLP